MITLQDAKDQLNITDTTHDNEIQVYVDATTGAVERLRGEVIDPRQVTDEFDLGYVSSFMLNNVPVLSLTSVTRIDGSITWDLASLHVNQKSGQVTLLSGAPVSGLVAVTYQAGYTVVPPNFQLAARIIVQHLWMTQRGDKGATRAGGMGTSVVPGIGFAIPNRALELLGTGLPGIA